MRSGAPQTSVKDPRLFFSRSTLEALTMVFEHDLH